MLRVMPSTIVRPVTGHDADELLKGLGRRVRDARVGRGMTQRRLADASGLSLRFVSQVENGQGNIAVGRLAQVASALGEPVARLLPDGAAPAYDLAAELDALDAGQLAAVRAYVRELRGAAPPKVIALLGIRGAGKSSVGQRLAEQLEVPFVELDRRIEAAAAMSLGDLFAIHGEPYYRQLQLEALQAFIGEGQSAVLATGGSLVTHPESWKLLREHAYTIWLRAGARDHWDRVLAQGDDRPMRRNPQAFQVLEALVAERRPLYEQADRMVDTSGRRLAAVVAEVAGAISG